MVLDQVLIDALTAVDTPTICNALEIANGGKRSNQGFTIGVFQCAHPNMKPILGFARTATIKTHSPYTDQPSVLKARRLAFYQHMDSQGQPTIGVIQDTDDNPGTGAFWGEVHSHVLKGLGVKGVITNGAMRDFGMLAEDFQILAPVVSPSHAFAQVVDVDVTVQVLGMTVKPNDLIHADRHGAVVIPLTLLEKLPKSIEVVFAKERPIIEAAKQTGFSFDLLKAALDVSEDIH
jgi:regulator of RNase E activity RraA